MKIHKGLSFLLGSLLFFALVSGSRAQESKHTSRFSHKGVKASVGAGSFDMISERNLAEGDGGMVNLGYGFTQRFSLWVTLLGSNHRRQDGSGGLSDFTGLELNVEHKFENAARFQPYAKVGGGLYFLEERGSPETLVGSGVNLALGLDFFFARHFGVGAEVMYKKLDYFSKSTETPDGRLERGLRPNLNGDTFGFMLTFTVE